MALTDLLVHPPPTSGLFAYNTYRGPGKGKSFLDPVFSTMVTQLTAEAGRASASDLYSKNGNFNADGTRMWHNTPDGAVIIDTTTGAVVQDDVPGNFDGSFDPVDLDVWYSFRGNALWKYSVATEAVSIVKVFGAELGPLGGSLDWISHDGRYMVLAIGGRGRLWDKQRDVLYAGAIPLPSDPDENGWLALSPDGKYVVAALGQRIASGQPIRSYAVDHNTSRVSTTGVMFWSLAGDHGDLVSVDDRTFLVTKEAHSEAAIYRVDVSLLQDGLTDAGLERQRSSNKLLLDLAWLDIDGHISCGGEWAYVSVESVDDPHGGGVTNWRPFKQEVLRIHVLTGEVQRLAHHRSRGLGGDGNYRWQPRVCASWDGSRVAWASNMGANVEGYADLFTINLGASGPVDPPPTPLSDTESFRITIGGKSRTFRVVP